MFKIEFEKAYDYNLDSIMVKMGFSPKRRQWVLDRGDLTEEFKMDKGTPPLSFFLFLLVAEGLNMMIKFLHIKSIHC